MNITNKIVEQLKSLPRYDKNVMYGSCVMDENKDGEYVEYEDIQKIIDYANGYMIDVHWQEITDGFDISGMKIIELKNKIASMCLEYSEMESKYNIKARELFNVIHNLSEVYSKITNNRNSFIAEKESKPILTYKPIRNGYYWVKRAKVKDWEIMKFHNDYFYQFEKTLGIPQYRFEIGELFEVGKRIEYGTKK
jgi:hypothetical protein